MVENLALKRRPFPNLEVVYFISLDSVEDALKDFDEALPRSKAKSKSKSESSNESVSEPPLEYMYKAIHLFVASGLTQTIIDGINQHRAFADRCVSLYDANIDFIVEEGYVAHFNAKKYIPNLIRGVAENVAMQKFRTQV